MNHTKLTIRQIRYLVEVSRQGSIQAASQALAISQSSIIAAITAAEHEVGAKLFERRPAVGILPTPAGQRFVRSSLALLAAEEEFARSLVEQKDMPPAHIRIGCFEPFGALFMPTVIRRYIDKVGASEVSLIETDHAKLISGLVSGTMEFAVGYNIGPDMGQSATPICRLPAHALISTDNALASQSSVSLAQLAEQPFVLLDLPHTDDYLLRLFELMSLRPKVSFRSRSYQAVRSAVAAGFGISIHNMRPVNYAMGDPSCLARVPISDNLPAPILQVIDIYGQRKPLFVRRFIDAVRDFFLELGPTKFAVAMPQQYSGLMFEESTQ